MSCHGAMCYPFTMRRRQQTLAPVVLLALSGCNELLITTLEVTDLFQQSPYEKVDVLLVVDNSGSMAPYQEKLGQDFGGFFDYFAEGEVDWHLAVTHTDFQAEDFGLIRGPIVTSEATDPKALFAEVVNVGDEGGGIETGLAAAARVLENQRDGFPRDDASVSIIFVSDEQDASPMSVASYVNRYYDLRGQRQRAAINASALTVTELADCTPEQFEASSSGTRYVEVARLMGGITANLCVDDFAQIVVDLALTTSTMQDTYFLRQRPNLNTLAVRIAGELVGCETGQWAYGLVERDGTEVPAIVFDRAQLPVPGAEILVEYEPGGGKPEDFCPAEAP